jgi:hypothetical protein
MKGVNHMTTSDRKTDDAQGLWDNMNADIFEATFVADGGVDDLDSWDDESLHKVLRDQLQCWAFDPIVRQAIIDAGKKRRNS